VYADNEKKRMMYGEFENWLNMYGKNIMVGKSNKCCYAKCAHSIAGRRCLIFFV
jgi:hypothetical protein